MQALFIWLAKALGDGENPSSSRLIAVVTLLSVYLVPLFIWAGLSINDAKMAEIPQSVLGFIGVVSTPLLTFVHLNKRSETQ